MSVHRYDRRWSLWSRQQLQDCLLRFMNLVEEYYGRAPFLYSYSRFYNGNLAPEFNGYLLFTVCCSSNSPIVNGAGRHYVGNIAIKVS
ncbi:hypothetical protein [Hoylesella pleuritidis]|uniref:hypothetical protein n=1 Tax=Hoylesella pleuritidis TaxID=407975 RepID=UPI0028D5579D|nr:hypothetical protein [Hoylesella pleuritidis]